MLTHADSYPAQATSTVVDLPRPSGGRRDPGWHASGRQGFNAVHANLETCLDEAGQTLWCLMRPVERPSFTPALLDDIASLQRSIGRSFAAADPARPPFRYFVLGSATPGIYSLGGDLGYFVEKIRQRDRAGMQRYAHLAVEAVHRNHVAFTQPVVTIGLVQGDALGGGFECALSLDVIVAERSSKLGLPEIIFNLFPGMGAYSFLSRRLDAVRAEQIIKSGKIYTAQELREIGLVDIVAEDGQGEAAVRDYTERHVRKHNAHHAIYRARRRVNPVTLDELRDVVDIWVDAAMTLEEPDLRKMERLRNAQTKRFAEAMAPLALAAE